MAEDPRCRNCTKPKAAHQWKRFGRGPLVGICGNRQKSVYHPETPVPFDEPKEAKE